MTTVPPRIQLHGSKEAREVILLHEWAVGPPGRAGHGDLRTPKFDVCITTYETFTNSADVFRKVLAVGRVRSSMLMEVSGQWPL